MVGKHKDNIRSKPLKRIIISPNFKDFVKNLSKLKIIKTDQDIDFAKYDISHRDINMKLRMMEKNIVYRVDAKKGFESMDKYPLIAAYDESINKFTALEGSAYLFSHTLIYLYGDDYVPTSYITVYFFTKSRDLKFGTDNGVIITEDVSYASKNVYVKDKVDFLKDNVYSNTLLFIDGPLIGGDWYVGMITAIKEFFTPNNIIPIFMVKNSQSSVIVDNIEEFKGKYNSDMHWAYYNLDKGTRTAFFIYRDLKNPRNARVFCYLKAFDTSPIRIEFHPITFEKYKPIIQDILDMIYYFLLLQGDSKNPQIRPIAIAEKYARETIHLFNLEEIVRSSGFTPTVNQERFGWS